MGRAKLLAINTSVIDWYLVLKTVEDLTRAWNLGDIVFPHSLWPNLAAGLWGLTSSPKKGPTMQEPDVVYVKELTEYQLKSTYAVISFLVLSLFMQESR